MLVGLPLPNKGPLPFGTLAIGREVRLCDQCVCVRPCVPCVSRLPPVSFLPVVRSRLHVLSGPGCPHRSRLRLVCEVLVSVSCVSRLPPVSYWTGPVRACVLSAVEI